MKIRATAIHPEHPEGTLYEAEPLIAARDLYHKVAISADDPYEEKQPPREDKRRYKRRDLRAEK